MEVFTIMSFLTIFPLGAAIIGALFFMIYYRWKTKSALTTSISWILYSIYEYLMYTRVLGSGENNIRVDLLLIYPILLILSALAIIIFFNVKRKSKKLRKG